MEPYAGYLSEYIAAWRLYWASLVDFYSSVYGFHAITACFWAAYVGYALGKRQHNAWTRARLIEQNRLLKEQAKYISFLNVLAIGRVDHPPITEEDS